MNARPDKAVDPDAEISRKLLYVEDYADVEITHPLAGAYEEGQICANCAQWRGDRGAEWMPCTIFYNRLVPALGWCTVWSLQPYQDPDR